MGKKKTNKSLFKKDTFGAFSSDYKLPKYMGDQNLTNYHVPRSFSSYFT